MGMHGEEAGRRDVKETRLCHSQYVGTQTRIQPCSGNYKHFQHAALLLRLNKLELLCQCYSETKTKHLLCTPRYCVCTYVCPYSS